MCLGSYLRPCARLPDPLQAGQLVIPPRADGHALPPEVPPISWLTVDGRPARSIFDNRALTRLGPVGLAGQSDPASSTHTPPIEPSRAGTWNLNRKIVERPSTTVDSDIRVNIHPLRHIYDVAVDEKGLAVIQMTLHATSCPATVTLPICVQRKVNGFDCVSDLRVDLLWETPRNKTRAFGAACPRIGIFQ